MPKNRFKDRCADCGLMVEVGRGTLSRENGRTVVRHDDCEDAENNLQDQDPYDMTEYER